MKKELFGYKISDVNAILDSLREENASLNATITTLKTQIKNNVGDVSAKSMLLENELSKSEKELMKLNKERDDLLTQISYLTKEKESLNQKNIDLNNQIELLLADKKDSSKKLTELQSQLDNEATTFGEAAITVEEFLTTPMNELPDNTEIYFNQDKSDSTASKDRDLTKYRSDIINYMNESLNTYQKLVSESSDKNKVSKDVHHLNEYNYLIHDLYIKAIDFFANLSNIDLTDKNIN